MFGYIVINQGEMKFKDFDVYHSYYCGLCKSLKELGGKKAQLTLSYDMTFLVMLLTALYEPKTQKKLVRCEAHPTKKHLERKNIFSDYCADMNLILTYYKCMDDWMDAYEDIEEDSKKGNYNPFLVEKEKEDSWQPVFGQKDFDEKCEQMLRMMMAECSRAFETLPILQYGDILRNILYSGVWTRFGMTKQKREKKQEEDHEGSI